MRASVGVRARISHNQDTSRHMLLAFCTLAATGLLHVPPPALRTPVVRHRSVIHMVDLSAQDISSEAFKENFAGCANGNERPAWQGAALAGAATVLWYLGTNTKTNKERESVEGPGVRRRALLLVLLLQFGAATGRGNVGKACTEEEAREMNYRKLKAKGFDMEKTMPDR